LNPDSILINFIKDNLKIFQQKDFHYDLYRDKKHVFFYKFKNHMGKPKDSEIAETAIFYLINKHMIKDIDQLEKLLTLPFFKDNIKEQQKQKLVYELNMKSPQTHVIIDPAKVEQREYQERLEEQILEKVLDKNKERLEEQKRSYELEFEEKKKALATIPTILESEEFEEPVINEEKDEDIKEWWQLLNLTNDPFPLTEGLQKIDKKIYEEIIVKTTIFKKYVSYTKDLKNLLYKNTIFYGDFGSGKTSFFDYIKEILLRNKILAIQIALWPVMDVDIIIKEFEHGLIKRLQDWCSQLGIRYDHSHRESNIEIIRSIFSILRNSFDGIIIIIDDLHKNQKAFASVMDFISYLQIITSNLTKETPKETIVNIGIYLAGIPQWKSGIRGDPRLSGSLIREEEFPLISIGDANEMLNKRLIAFAKNPVRKNIVGNSFIIQVYEQLKNQNLPVTFRNFIRKTLDEFEKKNFDILTVNPRAISKANLQSIKDIILENPNLYYKFDKLLSFRGKFHLENFRKCFDFLGVIYLEDGILEDSEQASRNYWVLQQLERCGLINYYFQYDKLKWHINNELLEKNQEIVSKYGVSLEDYLIPIFIDPNIQVSQKIDIKEIKILQELLQIVKDDHQKFLVKDTISLCNKLIEIDKTHRIDIPPIDLVQLCIRSLANITRIFPNLERIESNKDNEVLNFWREFWLKPESVIEFLNQTVDHNKDMEISHSSYIFSLYKEAFESILNFIKQEYEKNNIISISYAGLSHEDAKTIYEVRNLWINRDYFQAAQTINQHVEIKLRDTIYNIFKILYGPYERRIKRIDEETRKRMFVNIEKDNKKGFRRSDNELQYLDRKDYKKIMTREAHIGHQNWEEIFQHVFNSWKENNLIEFLNNFADFNTATSHMKTDVISNDQQHMLLRLILDSIFFIKKLNISYRMIITNCIYSKDKKCFFSFHQFKDQYSLTEINYTFDDAKSLMNKFINMEEIKIDLSKPTFIENIYNIEYRNFLALISLFIKVNDDNTEKRKRKFSIKKDKTPVFIFNLENA
jgi:hypothetical protein